MQGDPASRVARWRAHIELRLGRAPRGLRDVSLFDSHGQPAVIRVASVVDGKPFPTLYWLIDPEVNLALDRLEAGGFIAELQSRVDGDPELRARMAEDHALHRSQRDAYLTRDERNYLERRGMMSALRCRGIGGIAGPDRVRCLHTWYAAHLVEANAIGTLIHRRLSDLNKSVVCSAPTL